MEELLKSEPSTSKYIVWTPDTSSETTPEPEPQHQRPTKAKKRAKETTSEPEPKKPKPWSSVETSYVEKFFKKAISKNRSVTLKECNLGGRSPKNIQDKVKTILKQRKRQLLAKDN